MAIKVEKEVTNGGVQSGQQTNGKGSIINGNGKVNTGKGGMGTMITNIMTTASAACYIGQNGLYQTSKGKEIGKVGCHTKTGHGHEEKKDK